MGSERPINHFLAQKEVIETKGKERHNLKKGNLLNLVPVQSSKGSKRSKATPDLLSEATPMKNNCCLTFS